MRVLTRALGAAALSLGMTVTQADAQELSKRDFKAVGSWHFTTNYQKVEHPF